MANPIQDRAEDLLAAVITAMASTPAGAPAWSLVAPGDQPWDRCCDGAAWVRIVRAFAYERFPVPIDGPLVICPAGYAAELEVVHLRCAPAMPRQTTGVRAAPKTPGSDALEEGAVQLHADAYAVTRAVGDQLQAWRDDDLSAGMTQWIPLGPEGGCIGGSITVLVELVG